MPTATPTPLEAAEAASQEALATMEAEAAEFFAARDESRTAPLNPVAPALDAAKAAPAAKAPRTAAKPASQTSSAAAASANPPSHSLKAPVTDTQSLAHSPVPSAAAKISGAPQLTAKAAEPTPAGEPAAADAAKPDAAATGIKAQLDGVSRDYKPGTPAANWNKLHAALDQYESLAATRQQEAEELRAQLEALRASTAATAAPEVEARLTALQGERDSLLSQLRAVAGERIFDADSKPRRDAAVAQAKAAAGTEAARIEQLLALPESAYRDEQLEAVIASLPSLRATKLASAVAELDRLTSERASAAANGNELWQRRLADEAARTQAANAERIARATATFDAELPNWQGAGVTADEIETARSVYTGKGASLQDCSRAALWGAIGPRVASQLSDARARVAELEGELSKLRSAQPGLGAAASGALPSEAADDDDLSVTSYADRIAKAALRGGVRFGV